MLFLSDCQSNKTIAEFRRPLRLPGYKKRQRKRITKALKYLGLTTLAVTPVVGGVAYLGHKFPSTTKNVVRGASIGANLYSVGKTIQEMSKGI